MKKIFAAMVAALLMVALVSSTAFASNGKATQFTATYPVGAATWTCSGVHIVNKTIKDSETCVISGDTTGYLAGTYTGAPVGAFPPYGSITWLSDFNGALATTWTITMTDNGDGTFTANIVAYYASP